MNIYIDFDNTLYETAKLTEKMFEAICNIVLNDSKLNKSEFIHNMNLNFDSSSGNIYEYSKYIASKHNIDENLIFEAVDKVVLNGKNLVYNDAINFLEKVKVQGNNLHLLTYIPKSNHNYQMKKIIGSGIASYFESIIITTKYKFDLDLDYSNGIFIDDDLKNLNGLFEKKALRVIRIRKPNNKHSKEELTNTNIEEYENFDEIKI